MEYRKLGKTSSQRKALLRNQVTALLVHEKIVTTEARAKEVQKIAEKLITLAVKEKDNFETVKVKAKVARKDKDGKRIKEEKEGKLLRQERYAGTMQRSFYVGDSLTEEDIHAKYEDGVLRVDLPKKEARKVPEKKQILIG
jgi:ribosomal protein L17